LQARQIITSTARTLLLTFVAYFGVAQGAQAATAVSGAISANTTWSLAQSPYQVTADISVENGATLTIEAGVVVSFDAARNLTITSGALSARGTAGQPITLTSTLDATGGTPAPGNWGQLRFLNGTNDSTTVIEHAQIRYGKGITVQAASPTFNYLQITDNQGSAISIDLASSPKGVGNQASGNTLNGISVPPGDLTGSVTWGIKGIHYVVASGIVSVGNTPILNTLSLNEIQQGDTINATLGGSRLSGAQSIGFNTAGLTATIQSGATDTSVPVRISASPTAILGIADIDLQVAAGRPTLSAALHVIQPQPTVTGLNPGTLYSTLPDSALTVNGKNFVPESIIRLDGTDLTTIYASATSLSTTLPVLTPGNKSITVKQPDPLLAEGFLISKPAVLSVTVPPLSISPASASQTQGVPFSLTISIPFAAPSGGLTVNLASSATTIATIPANITIAEGATSATVPVSSVGVGVTTITASRTNFASATAQIQVLALPALTITSAKLEDVVGNNFSLAINASNVAGAGGLAVSLSSSNTAVATVPASVTISAGTKTLNVQITALAIGKATITGTANGFAAGNATVTVRPVTQNMTVSPLPVAIPPDSVARKITLKLAAVDAIDHVFTASIGNATVATIGATSVTIPAGQTTAQLLVSGLKEGSTSISLVSSTLGTVVVPVYVTGEYAGINMSYAPAVGVMKESSAPVMPPQTNALVSSSAIGIAFGNYITGMTPKVLTIDSGTTTLTVNGEGLLNATAVNIYPADGLTIGTFSVNPDGKSLTVPVTVAANAATTLRQVVVTGGTGPIKATTANADRLLISLPLPEVTSVDPLFAVPGNTVSLVVRGRNLQNAQPITISPSDGITAGSSVTVSSDGSQLTTTISINASAAYGARVVQVTTPAGTSDDAASSYNTLTLVSQVQGSITPIASPLVGLVRETVAPPPANQTYGLSSALLGITKGPTVSGITPAVGAIGDTVTMTVTGSELQNVTALQFNPATGLTVDTPVVAADGKSLSVNVVVDATAPLGARALKVLAGTTALPFSKASSSMFNVILPEANITSVEPIVIPIPSGTFTLALNGSNFQSASAIRITPNTDVTIANPPAISANGTLATVTITVAATAAAGSRMVSIVTPAGESSTVATVANSVTLTATPGSSYPMASPLVGLVKETTPTPPASTTITPIASPIVGVVLETNAVPPTPNMNVYQPSPLVGVLYGSAAYTLSPEGMLAGDSGILTVTGIGLDAVTSAAVSLPTGVTLGALQASPDGTQLNIPITLSADAAVGYRWLTLSRTGGLVNFQKPSANNFWVATALPALDSVTPNVAQQGTTQATFTIRGSNLHNATAVVAEPADGITFGVPSVDATGTVLTVGMVIDAAAPTTARVIRVSSHGVMSSAVAVPANTLTVYP